MQSRDSLNASITAGVLEWNNKREDASCLFDWRDQKAALAKPILQDLSDLIATTQRQRESIQRIADDKESRLLEQMSDAIIACADSEACYFCDQVITPEQVTVGQIIDNNGAFKPVKVHCHCDYNAQILFNARIVAFTQHQPPMHIIGRPRQIEENDSQTLKRKTKPPSKKPQSEL